MSDFSELTQRAFQSAIPASVRRRLVAGRFESGEDVEALRRFIGLSQARFAEALGIGVSTLRDWERGRRPSGAAIVRLRSAARHPRSLRSNGVGQRATASNTAEREA